MYVHTQVLQKMSYVHACHMSWRDEIPPVAFWVQHALRILPKTKQTSSHKVLIDS